jgi:DNA polymerase (family 10)
VRLSIGADAHSTAGIKNVEFGVAVARKGWLGPEHVLNARPVESFLALAAKRRSP